MTDSQLQIVHQAANLLPSEKRAVFLQRVRAILLQRGRTVNDDADVAKAVEATLARLVCRTSASAQV